MKVGMNGSTTTLRQEKPNGDRINGHDVEVSSETHTQNIFINEVQITCQS